MTTKPTYSVWRQVIQTIREKHDVTAGYAPLYRLGLYFATRYPDEWRRPDSYIGKLTLVLPEPEDSRVEVAHRFDDFWPGELRPYQVAAPLMGLATDGPVQVAYAGCNYQVSISDPLTCIDFELTPPGDGMVREYVEAMLHYEYLEG